MIQLVPFYLNMTASIHTEERKTSEQNTRFSISLLHSLLPSFAEYLNDTPYKSIVILTPSRKESQIIISYLIRYCADTTALKSDLLSYLKFSDLKPERIVDDHGVHIMTVQTASSHLVSCDALLSYYPLTAALLKTFYSRTRNLVLFDPMNKRANWYAEYIKTMASPTGGVVK